MPSSHTLRHIFAARLLLMLAGEFSAFRPRLADFSLLPRWLPFQDSR